LSGQGEGLLKCGTIGDDMIGRKHGHYPGMVPGCDPASAKCNGRCRVAFGWLTKNVLVGETGEQFTNSRFLLRIR
jgi:hypothetical protein